MKKITFTKKALALFLAIAMVFTGLYIPKSNVRIVNAEDETETVEETDIVGEIGNATNITGNTIATNTEAEAKIGEEYFDTLKNALTAAKTANGNVTIELLKNVEGTGNFDILSENLHKITIDGKNTYSITGENGNNTIRVGTSTTTKVGAVELKNLTIVQKNSGAAVQVNYVTTLDLTNVTINAFNPTAEANMYGLINLNVNGTGKAVTKLNMTGVIVDMDVTLEKGTNTEWAIVRTGNKNESATEESPDKTVEIKLKDCRLNAEDSTRRKGILVMKGTAGTVHVEDSTIATNQVWPIQTNSTFCTITKSNATLKTKTFGAAIGTKTYTSLTGTGGALEAAKSSTTPVTIELFKDVNITGNLDILNDNEQKITIDGNRNTIKGENGNNTIRVGTSSTTKVGAVELKNLTISQKNRGAAVQVNYVTTLDLTNVTINAVNPTTSGDMFGLINLNVNDSGKSVTTLNMNNVTVDMDVTLEKGNNWAIVRTGNNDTSATAASPDKTVEITIKGCTLDSAGSTKRYGVLIMQGTAGTVEIEDSTITTNDVEPILNRSSFCSISLVGDNLISNASSVAFVGYTVYSSLKAAVEAVRDTTTNVTIELAKNHTMDYCDIYNASGKNIIIDGNGCTLTTSGTGADGNAFRIYGSSDGTGTYEFKDMDIIHGKSAVLVQIRTNSDSTYTTKKSTVNLNNIDITNTNNGGYKYGLITTLPGGNDVDMRLNLDNVDVTMTFDSDELGTDTGIGAGVIRTGNNDAKNVTINLTKCNFNLENAAQIKGILVTNSSNANIFLDDTDIKTKTVAPIQANDNAGTDNTITFSGDCKLDSSTATYKAAPIQGYDAQVGNKVYRTFATAIAEAEAGATVEVLQDLSTGWRDITKSMTIDGNGYEITSTAGDENNKFLFVVKDDATEFKIKDLNIKHLRRGMVVRTDIPTTVTLEKVHIDATQAPVSTEYALFNLTAAGTTNLIWNDVTVDMDATTAGLDDNPAIIRTGNDGTKNINITLTDCNLNTEGAAGRHGIVIMSGATATLNLTGTTITTLDVVPIKDNTGNATINTTDCTLTYTGIEAIIGDNLYKTFAEALEAANESKTDVTLEILKDISIGAGNTLANENGKSITIEGHNHVLTATGGQHTFMITTTQAGTVEFKNMTIEHQNKGSAVQIADSITGEKITVKLTDVTINATESTEGYDHAIINVLNENTTDLVMTDVTITMSTELDGSDVSPYWGIIRTGNSADKTVNMTLTNCTLDASGAKDRHGIVVISKTTANIVLQNTTIKSGNVAPIKNHATTSQTIELTNCTFDSTTEAYKTAPIEGYEAQVDDVVYCKFSDALTAANQAEESVTLKLLAEITVNQNVYIGNENGKAITFDGNGNSVTTAGGSNNHAFRINEDCTVSFKNITVYHKNMGSFVQVEENLNEVTLSLANVIINANDPDNTSVSATVGNYNYALINVFSSATVNLTDVTVDMDVTQNGRDYPGIVRTGNHSGDEKTVTINVNGGNWNTEGATGRHGIVIMKKTNAKVNLKGATITTANAAPIADYSQNAVITRDEETTTTCTGNYEAYVLGINNSPTHKVYENFADALADANGVAGSVTLGLLKNVSVGAANIGNAKGKLILDGGNTYKITTENGNHAFTVNQNNEVEFRDMTIEHKRYGAAIQVNAAGATLSLTNVFLDAQYPPQVKQSDNTYISTYNYALINLLTSSTLNMTNSRAIMVVEALGAGGGNQSSIIRTGNQDTNKDEAVYKEITINLTDCILDTTSATNRSGILVVDAKTDINLKGITKILTQAGDKCATIRGLEGTRVAKISMEETCLLKTGESTAYADVIKNVEERITDACTWTYKQYNNLSAFRTESGLKAPTTVPTGYVFAGWYSNKACTAEYALAANDFTTTSAYAKFVPDHVIDVKAQLSTNLLDGSTDGEKGAIRFVTTVDSLDYTEVGFDYIIQISDTVSKTGTVRSSTVYKTLYAVGDKTSGPISYTPDEAFCGVSQYFKAITIKNIPQTAFNAEITVTPFWVTLDGTKVYGDPATKTVNQGIDAADSEGNITEDSENTGSVYTNRVVMVSDLHYTTSDDKKTYDNENKYYWYSQLQFKKPNASWAAGNAFGYTQEQKLQAALDDINAFGLKNTLDAVMVLGDLTLDDYGYRNLVNNYLDDFKLNFMDKLSPSYATYAIAGNHDSYTNSEWKNTIGTDRQYSVVIGDAVFIMLDTFAAQHATSGSGSAYVGVDIDFLRTELQKAEYADKTIFLCSHYYQQGEHPENDTALNELIANDDRIVCMFRAHSHKNVVGTPSALAGSPLVDIGGYAYNGQQEDDGSYEFNTFDKSWAWGYQVVEWNESEVHIYHVKSARKYTDCNGIEHNYKGAIEGDMVIKIGE